MQLTEKIQESFVSWAKANLAFAATMLFLRILFFFNLVIRINIDWSKFGIIMSGLKFDVVLAGSVAVATLIPYCLIHYFSPKTARITAGSAIALYALISSLLTEYFCVMTRPLDHVLFVYSTTEMADIVMSSTSVSLAAIINIVLSIGLPIGLIIGAKKLKFNLVPSVGFLLIATFLAFGFRYQKMVREESGYRQQSDFYLAVNQLSFSFINITDYLNEYANAPEPTNANIAEAATRYHMLLPQFEYDDTNYPFWRKFNDCDVLGRFLKKTDNGAMPNFVFIIIEGFGQELTGVANPEVSFTPFIDSLAANGLYWKNCLSTAERTFGALPAIFASVPHGKGGFGNLWNPIPDHNSMLKDLSANGYQTSFFYGGSPSFDGQDIFLTNNHIDYILKCTPDSTDSERYKAQKENHRWGLDDGEMFDLAIKHKQTDNCGKPTADIFLTLTTHEPFDFPEIASYMKKVAAMPKSRNKLEQKNIRANQNIFATFLYTDDCVRKLFNYYKIRPDFENTIFVITGDHHMGPLQTAQNPLMKYHVPLIVYSPMLERTKTMEAVVSHLDITPTVISYLSTNYNFKIGTHCHWLGTSFDSTSTFVCRKKQAFMLNNRDVVDFLTDSLLISNNRLFAVNSDLQTEQIDNLSVCDSIRQNLNDYQTISCHAVTNDYLMKNTTEGKTNICHINTNFEGRIDSVFRNQLTTINNNKCLIINKDTEYGQICPNLELKDNCRKLKVEIRFTLQSLDTTTILPKLILEKKGKQNYYLAVPTNSNNDKKLNTGQKENFVLKTTVEFEQNTDGEVFKIYLWNSQHSSMLYDNLYVNINQLSDK